MNCCSSSRYTLYRRLKLETGPIAPTLRNRAEFLKPGLGLRPSRASEGSVQDFGFRAQSSVRPQPADVLQSASPGTELRTKLKNTRHAFPGEVPQSLKPKLQT